ncbi:putative receptor protein kinase ZmPK1 [Hordeum vulgare]|nr:putative receptor protein kinase ZmPK1 [Hordeum vulgare]
MTWAGGIVASASAPAVMKPPAAPSKLPNATRPKKGKTSAKKNKAVGGSGTSKASRKKLAGRVRGEAATEAPMSSLVEPAADAHNVFDNMPQSVNDNAYMPTMGVGSNNSHWSQTNDMHYEDHEFEVDEDDDDEEDASSEDAKRSPTPNSVSYSKPKRPDGCKKDAKEKKKRKGDDELKNAMEAIVNARKEANEVRQMARNQVVAAEERRVATEKRKVALEERKVGMEEQSKLLEWEKHLFFLDTSLFNDAQKEYVSLPVKKS